MRAGSGPAAVPASGGVPMAFCWKGISGSSVAARAAFVDREADEAERGGWLPSGDRHRDRLALPGGASHPARLAPVVAKPPAVRRAFVEIATAARWLAWRALSGPREPDAPLPASAGRIRAAKGKSARAARPAALGAEAFWRLQAEAVAAIRGEYGDHWAVRAPHGATVLAEIPSKLRSYKTPRGVVIRYRADWRLPAAQYWPGGVLPEGLTLADDSVRETAPIVRVVAAPRRNRRAR